MKFLDDVIGFLAGVAAVLLVGALLVLTQGCATTNVRALPFDTSPAVQELVIQNEEQSIGDKFRTSIGLFHSNRNWGWDDTLRQAIITGIWVIDWGQTRYIAENPTRYYELNSTLGEHPTVSAVDKYFVRTILIHTGISYLLPDELTLFDYTFKPRATWQYFSIGFYGMGIKRNAAIGIKVSF